MGKLKSGRNAGILTVSVRAKRANAIAQNIFNSDRKPLALSSRLSLMIKRRQASMPAFRLIKFTAIIQY